MLPHISIGSLQLPTFGLMMMLGMLAAFALVYCNRKRVPYTEDDLVTMALYAIIGGFIGSKVLFWIVELDHIIANPHYLLETLTSGFVFYGSLIAGTFSIFLFTHRKKHVLLAYTDLVMPAFILAQGFGRIGCFAAGCCYGAVCDSALSVVYPAGAVAPAGVPLLPTQLFESAFCILFAIALTAILRQEKRYGTTTGIYFIGYGVWRFIIEFFRSDDRGAVGALSTSQFIGIFIVIAGIALLCFVKRGKTAVVAELFAAMEVDADGNGVPDMLEKDEDDFDEEAYAREEEAFAEDEEAFAEDEEAFAEDEEARAEALEAYAAQVEAYSKEKADAAREDAQEAREEAAEAREQARAAREEAAEAREEAKTARASAD